MAQSVLADGFVNLCIDPSLNFYDGKCRVLVEGQADGSATADALRPVPSSRNIDDLFGEGTVLSLALKKVFCTCPNNVEVFAIPRADPSGAVAAQYTWTFTGTATSDGRIEIFAIDKDYSINILVEEGDTPTVIAGNVLAALPDDFPYTAVQAAGVLTLTAISTGTVGNFLEAIYNWRNMPDYAPEGVTFAQVQSVAGTGELLPLDYAALLGTCCYSCFALLSGGDAYQTAWQLYLESLWSCDTPQCFGHGYTYNSGSLGQILARGTNAAVFNRVAQGLGSDDPIPPWLKVAAYAALSCCTACASPELSIQGQNYGVLSCLFMPESCVIPFTYDEQVQLKEAGFVVMGPLTSGQGAYTNPYVFNDVTNYLYDDLNRPNATFRDTNSRRLLTSTAIAIATELQQYSALALFTKNTNIRQGIFGTNKRLMQGNIRAWAKENVGVLFGEFDNIENDIVLQDDFEVMPACQGVPGKLHLKLRYRQPVRIGQINTLLQPQLLDNCVR
jgi:hypothetical protein